MTLGGRPGRPIDEGKREAVLAATRDRLLRLGFEAVTIEGVAADAGVSKVTVYKAFGSREDLIAQLIGRESDRMEAEVEELLSTGGDGLDALVRFGVGVIGFLSREDVLRLDARMAQAGEAFQPLVVRYLEAGPERLVQALRTLVDELQSAGQLPPVPPGIAADTLLALWQVAIPFPVRLGLAPPLTEREREAIVRRGTRIFFDGWKAPSAST